MLVEQLDARAEPGERRHVLRPLEERDALAALDVHDVEPLSQQALHREGGAKGDAHETGLGEDRRGLRGSGWRRGLRGRGQRRDDPSGHGCGGARGSARRVRRREPEGQQKGEGQQGAWSHASPGQFVRPKEFSTSDQVHGEPARSPGHGDAQCTPDGSKRAPRVAV